MGQDQLTCETKYYSLSLKLGVFKLFILINTTFFFTYNTTFVIIFINKLLFIAFHLFNYFTNKGILVNETIFCIKDR